MVVFLASIDTRHFSFHALGETEEHARRALRHGLVVHFEQVGRDYSPMLTAPERERRVAEFLSDATVLPVAMGGCYRDNDILAVTPVA